MHVLSNSVRQGEGRDFKSVGIDVTAAFLSRAFNDLPPITDKTSQCNPTPLVNAVHTSPTCLNQHFRLLNFFHTDNYPVTTVNYHRCTTAIHSFTGIFDLENAAIGGEGSSAEIVARAGGRHYR